MSASEETLPRDAWLRRNPSHPGGFVSDWMENSSGAHMTIAAAAGKLGVSVPALRRVLNGQAGISVTLALKLEAAGWGRRLGPGRSMASRAGRLRLGASSSAARSMAGESGKRSAGRSSRRAEVGVAGFCPRRDCQSVMRKS